MASTHSMCLLGVAMLDHSPGYALPCWALVQGLGYGALVQRAGRVRLLRQE